MPGTPSDADCLTYRRRALEAYACLLSGRPRPGADRLFGEVTLERLERIIREEEEESKRRFEEREALRRAEVEKQRERLANETPEERAVRLSLEEGNRKLLMESHRRMRAVLNLRGYIVKEIQEELQEEIHEANLEARRTQNAHGRDGRFSSLYDEDDEPINLSRLTLGSRQPRRRRNAVLDDGASEITLVEPSDEIVTSDAASEITLVP